MPTSSSGSPADPRGRRRSLLREDARFRRYFLGAATSLVGDRITFVAMPFAVLSVSNSAGSVAAVVAAQTVPFALLALFAGVIADRADRRRIVLTSDVVRMVTQVIAAVLLLSGSAEVWHLVVLMVCFGSADAFFMPATQGMLPQLVAGPRLQEANALRGMVSSSAMIGGPALAGVLVALLGPGGALAVDAGTFAVSAVCLAGVRPDPVRRLMREHEMVPSLLAGLREGWHEVRSRQWIGLGLSGFAVYTVVVLPAVFVLGPVIAERELGGAGAWAVISATFGVGSLIGSAIALRWRPQRPMVVVAVGIAVGSAQAAVLGSGLSLPVIAALEGITGIGVALFFTIWDSALQERVPEQALSRVTSYDFFLSIGLSGLGVAIAGPVADLVGLQQTMLAMSAIAVPLALSLLAFPAVRQLRRVEAGTS
ncbi:MFS transporter [Paraconexibacter sp.]|uniref:MFS transporter n=1 Tax=Paraconexibacter sp. TaxID=2949640 RepID=UPI003562112E